MTGSARVAWTPVFRALAVASLVLSPVSLRGQAPAPTRRSVCLDSIAPATLKRVPVYASAEVTDSVPVSSAILAAIDLFTQATAEAARALLGAGPAQLPPGEPAVTWRHLDHGVGVVAYPNGRMRWRVEPPDWIGEQTAGDDGARLIIRAVERARTNGEAFFWDPELRRDSLSWLVRLSPAMLSADGHVTAPRLRAGFPVFSVLAPALEPADVEQIRTNFPMMRIRGYAGNVLMQFVIDTNGRAIPSTIRGLWPPNEPRLIGPPAFAYDSLVRAMRGTLHEARFTPARLGGCVVSQLAQQAFLYRPTR